MILKKRIDEMIAITAAEKEVIRAKHPNVHIVRTMKAKSGRHRYYMAEESPAMRTLREIRSGRTPSGTEKKG